MVWIKKAVQALIGVALLIGLMIVLIELFSSATGPRAASSTIDPHATPTPTPVNPYAPSIYGIPDTLAGYNVLAVLAADTEACLQPGKKHLILQVSQTSVEDFLKASDPKALDTALRQADLTVDKVEIGIAGPGTTLDVMLSELQKWNQLMKNGCVQDGGPILEETPTATPAK